MARKQHVKLSEDQMQAIYEWWKAKQALGGIKKVAAQYAVHPSTVDHIVQRMRKQDGTARG